jgi:hypothetical protein
MHWLLVVIVLGAPVKTDLVFDDLGACLRAEASMRQQWADVLNEMLKQKKPVESVNFVTSQSTHGTCIPTK